MHARASAWLSEDSPRMGTFGLTPPAPEDLHVQMERNALQAAVKTAVGHVVKQSVNLAAPDAPVGIMRSHFRCEEFASGVGPALHDPAA